jgi:hypothetical protein
LELFVGSNSNPPFGNRTREGWYKPKREEPAGCMSRQATAANPKKAIQFLFMSEAVYPLILFDKIVSHTA